MERGPGCSMETLHEQCESQLYDGIGEEISKGSKGTRRREIYMMLVEVRRRAFLAKR